MLTLSRYFINLNYLFPKMAYYSQGWNTQAYKGKVTMSLKYLTVQDSIPNTIKNRWFFPYLSQYGQNLSCWAKYCDLVQSKNLSEKCNLLVIKVHFSSQALDLSSSLSTILREIILPMSSVILISAIILFSCLQVGGLIQVGRSIYGNVISSCN